MQQVRQRWLFSGNLRAMFHNFSKTDPNFNKTTETRLGQSSQNLNLNNAWKQRNSKISLIWYSTLDKLFTMILSLGEKWQNKKTNPFGRMVPSPIKVGSEH